MKLENENVGISLLLIGAATSLGSLLLENPNWFGQELNIPIWLRVLGQLVGVLLITAALQKLFSFRSGWGSAVSLALTLFLILGENHIVSLYPLENEGQDLILSDQGLTAVSVLLGIVGVIAISKKTNNVGAPSEGETENPSVSSNWEFGNSSHVWDIPTIDGKDATVKRVFEATCLGWNVTEWKEMVFGSDTEVSKEDYDTPNGEFKYLEHEPHGTFIIVRLHKSHTQGDELKYQSTRKLKEAFTQEKNWVSTNFFSTSIEGKLRMEVRLPENANISEAWVEVLKNGFLETNETIDAVVPSGKTRAYLRHTADRPQFGEVHTIKWIWKQ